MLAGLTDFPRQSQPRLLCWQFRFFSAVFVFSVQLAVGPFEKSLSSYRTYQLRWMALSGSIFALRIQWNCMATSHILLRLDNCKSPLSGLLASSVLSLRRIKNCAPRLTLKNTWNWPHQSSVSIYPLASSATKNSVQDKHSLLKMYNVHCSVLSLWRSSALRTLP